MADQIKAASSGYAEYVELCNGMGYDAMPRDKYDASLAAAAPAVEALTDEQCYEIEKRATNRASNWANAQSNSPSDEQYSGTFVRAILSGVQALLATLSTTPVAQTPTALQLRCEQDEFSAWSVNNLPKQDRPAAAEQPIPMILHCQKCGLQHIDAPETHEVLTESGLAEVADWTNPPHRSHLCHGCSHIWRPADVPTEGVLAIKTRGTADSPTVEQENPNAWKKFGEHTWIIPYKLIDVVLDNGVTLERQKERLVDWTAVRDWRYSDSQPQATPLESPLDPAFTANLARSRAKYPNNRSMLDGLCGELHELKRAYNGDGDVKAEALDVAVCAYRLAVEGDAGGNQKLELIPDSLAWGAPLEATSEQADELPISMSTYGSLAACEAERARRDEQMRREQVAAMVNRFLGWRLPKNFAPDCGIAFTPCAHPDVWPIGTNLLNADQAKEMIAYLLDNPGAAEGGATSESKEVTRAMVQAWATGSRPPCCNHGANGECCSDGCSADKKAAKGVGK